MKERMTGFLPYCCLYILSTVISNSAFGFEKEPDGFRGIKWGTDISVNQQEMYQLDMDKGEMEEFYVRINSKGSITGENKEEAVKKRVVEYIEGKDQETVGEAKVDTIIYIYYKNKFSGVLLNTHGDENRNLLIKTFITLFGYPSVHIGSEYEWRGDESTIRIKCNSTGCLAGILSTKIADQKAADKTEVARKKLEETKKRLSKDF